MGFSGAASGVRPPAPPVADTKPPGPVIAPSEWLDEAEAYLEFEELEAELQALHEEEAADDAKSALEQHQETMVQEWAASLFGPSVPSSSCFVQSLSQNALEASYGMKKAWWNSTTSWDPSTEGIVRHLIPPLHVGQSFQRLPAALGPFLQQLFHRLLRTMFNLKV